MATDLFTHTKILIIECLFPAMLYFAVSSLKYGFRRKIPSGTGISDRMIRKKNFEGMTLKAIANELADKKGLKGDKRKIFF